MHVMHGIAKHSASFSVIKREVFPIGGPCRFHHWFFLAEVDFEWLFVVVERHFDLARCRLEATYWYEDSRRQGVSSDDCVDYCQVISVLKVAVDGSLEGIPLFIQVGIEHGHACSSHPLERG